MPTLSITKTYSDTNALTEAMLDNIKNGIETFLNTTKIDGDNIQALGVPTAAIANSAITAAKLATDAVETAKILNDAVTTAKILDANVTADKLASNSVTTAKITDANVTREKLEDLSEAVSNATGGFNTSSTSLTPIVDTGAAALECSITGSGRPVFICFQPQATTSGKITLSTSMLFNIELRRDTGGGFTKIANWQMAGVASDDFSGSLVYVDTTAISGSNDYRLWISVNVGTVTVTNMNLVAFEL